MYIGEPAFWGSGYGQDAVMTLLGYAFDRWDLHRVELWALADNNRAIAVYLRCGFARDAVLPERSWKDGGWVDRVVMSVTRQRFLPVLQAWRVAAETA
jgi:RimJ/RimL family protein N-acetyltransferase